MDKMVFVDASEDLVNGKFKIKNLKISYYITVGENFTDNATLVSGQIKPRYVLFYGTDSDVDSLGSNSATLNYSSEFIVLKMLVVLEV